MSTKHDPPPSPLQSRAPDNVSLDSSGRFWIAMPARMTEEAINTSAQPEQRVALAQKKTAKWVPYVSWAAVAALSQSGEVVRFLADQAPMEEGGSGLWGISAVSYT